MTKETLIKTIEKLGRKNGSFYGFETITSPRVRKTSRADGKPCKLPVRADSFHILRYAWGELRKLREQRKGTQGRRA